MREELIQKLEAGDFTLSFSALKEFAKSPAHFIAYKLGDKKETAAMKKGTIIHCAILEPNELENRYCILNREDLPNPDKDFRDSANKAFKLQFEEKAKEKGKKIVTPDEWENALKHRDLAHNNEVVSPYLAKLVRTEQLVKFEFNGYQFRGVIDGLSKSFVLDLKTVSDASPNRLKWAVMDGKYHWQHFLYNQSDSVQAYFDNFNLLIDGNGGMVLVKIDQALLWEAESDLMRLLESFENCRKNNLWHQNYEFWAGEKGYFVIN